MKNEFLGKASANMSAFDVAKKWKVNPIDFIPILEKGTKHEMEHTDNIDVARRIALDHIVERLDYYDQLDKIEKMHLGGDMSKHLAPNGKPSNLTHEQWHLVRTPEFKAWFGDWENDPENASKVVDENGEPLIVYHGTFSKFDVFDKNELGMSQGRSSANMYGFYFSNNKKVAESFGKYVKGFFINVKKPKIKDIEGMDYSKAKDIVDDFISKIKDKIDGAILLNYKDSGGSQPILANQYIVPNSNQIKLADGTNTTFDGGNPDIRFDKGGATNRNFNDKELLKRYNNGESIGFTAIAHLKAKGLIERSDGMKRKSVPSYASGGRTIAQTPAPASDKVYGSKTNPKGSASDSQLAKSIKFNDSLVKAIENKVKAHNEEYPSKKVTLPTAKAVVRRGMGAYSKSHRPTITGGAPNSRQAWGLARLNKFLLKKRGVKVKSAYIQDDDLL